MSGGSRNIIAPRVNTGGVLLRARTCSTTRLPPGSGGMMRAYRLGLSIVALAGAIVVSPSVVQARELPATDAEKDEAGHAYIACQADKAGMLDDGYSDALTIGRAVASACRSEMENLAEVLTKGSKRDRVRLLLIDRLASHAALDASVVVLLERKRRADTGSSER